MLILWFGSARFGWCLLLGLYFVSWGLCGVVSSSLRVCRDRDLVVVVSGYIRLRKLGVEVSDWQELGFFVQSEAGLGSGRLEFRST